jgi:hypothetical protein
MQSFWGLCSRNSRTRNALGSTGTTSLALMKRNSPLSNLYIRETRDRFLSAQHSATCNFLRLTFRELLSASRKGPFLLAEV